MKKFVLFFLLIFVCIAVNVYGQSTQQFLQAQAAFERGMAAFTQKNFDKAIAEYTEALRLWSFADGTYYNRGLAYANRKNPGDLERAVADYSQAIRLDSTNAWFYIQRALVYEELNDNVRAIADYEMTLRINPNFNLARERLAILRPNDPTYVPPRTVAPPQPGYVNPGVTPPSNNAPVVVQCRNCGGTGNCSICRGNYRQSCRQCDGTGKRTYGYGANARLERCTYCNGMGYQLCTMYGKTCNNGKCTACSGRGVL